MGWVSVSRASIFLTFFAAILLSSNSVSVRAGRGVVKQKTDRHGQGKGGELKTGSNVGTSFMDDLLIKGNSRINM